MPKKFMKKLRLWTVLILRSAVIFAPLDEWLEDFWREWKKL